MSATPLRRTTRSASRDLVGTPAPVPQRSTRASSRASSRATDGTDPLPSLIGRASTAYGSPVQTELANAITPNRKASGLFAELAAKRTPGDAHATSDLDPQYPPVTRKSTTKRKTAPAPARPTTIPEEDSSDRDPEAFANATSVLGWQQAPRQVAPLHQHARQGAALPRSQRSRMIMWLSSLRFLSWRTALITLSLLPFVFAIALPLLPSGDYGSVLQKLQDRHYEATTSIASLFTKTEQPAFSSPEYAQLSRQISNLQMGQEQLSRRFAGNPNSPDAATRMVRNYEDATSQVNFFSAKLGAMVDILYSSPTRQRQKPSFFDQLFTGYRTLEPNEHITALLPWEEAGDCWCAPSASPPGQAKAQLAIVMPREMIPTTITIEHPPQKGLIEPGTTPREVSVWIQIEDAALRAEIAELTKPADAADNAMPDDYVEIAHFTYSAKPRDGNHIQSFGTTVSLADFADKGLGVRKAIVRVDSNYGADYTCLYRVRMHGRLLDSQDPLYNEYHTPAESPSWESSWH